MTEKPTDEQATDKVLTLVAVCYRTFADALFERLDKLHSEGIHDDQVIRALRKIGEVDLAAEYIDWAAATDPDAEGGDETDVVPDPASAGSYQEHPLNQPKDTRQLVLDTLIRQLNTEVQEGDLWFDFNHLDEVVLDGRVDFQKLADAIVKAVGK